MMQPNFQPQNFFLFNILPMYRPGLQRVYEFARSEGYVNGGYKAAYTIPTLACRIKQNTLYKGFEASAGDGLSALDDLLIFASDGGDQDFATLNWVDPANLQAIIVNTPTYTNKAGFTAVSATTSYINTTFSPSAGVNYQQNSAGVLHYVNTDGAGGSQDYGVSNGSSANRTIMNAGGGGNAMFYTINRTTLSTVANNNSIGFYHMKRTASSATAIHKNGVQLAAPAVASTGESVNTFFIGCENAAGVAGSGTFSSRQIGMWGAGAPLAGEETDLYTAWNTYFTSL